MSGSPQRGAGNARPAAPAASETIVAVLERRGRFLVAEPLFPRRNAGAGAGRRDRSDRLTIKSPGSGRGGVRAAAGDLVLLQRPRHGGTPRILRVLGRPDVARDVIEALMIDRGLRRGFDAAVERDAEGAAERVRLADEERRDLRALTTFTIDPVNALDFDDAISAEQLPGGLTRVWVHIADVAAHVREGSPVDREARRRATSVYVPGAVEPMLPHVLSSDACSLRPGTDRAAVTVELDLKGAAVTRTAFYRSLIRSDVRLDYDRVDEVFAGKQPAEQPWAKPLEAARRTAAELQRKREESGALVVESLEPEFSFDAHGDVAGVTGRVQTESHRLIEHLMIAANEAVAALLAQRSVPCLYRVHEPPDPERIERLVDQLASLEVPTPPVPKPLSSSQASELLGVISAAVQKHVRRTGRGRLAFGSLVLRSLKQAYYSPRNLGHAGLRSSSYCHFTSPIRRYPDLVCHRALLASLGAGEPAPRAAELAELGEWTSEREREAMTIERDADDVASCFALSRLLYEGGHDQVFTGEVTGLIPAGAFVSFGPARESAQDTAAPPFQGLLPVRLLRAPVAGARSRQAGSAQGAPGRRGRGHGARRPPGQAPVEAEAGREWWELNEEGTILRGERTGATVRLGDPIDVRVTRIEAPRGRVDLIAAG